MVTIFTCSPLATSESGVLIVLNKKNKATVLDTFKDMSEKAIFSIT